MRTILALDFAMKNTRNLHSLCSTLGKLKLHSSRDLRGRTNIVGKNITLSNIRKDRVSRDLYFI